MTRLTRVLAAAAVLLAAPAAAAPIIDPVGDFVPTYLGPPNGDLDVISAEVLYDGQTFFLHTTLAAAVGTTPGAFYVWGFDRGAGTVGFPTIADGVTFDQVVVVRADGTSNLPGVVITISGNDISAAVPAALLPPNGFAPEAFTWNLWPRSPVIPDNPLGNLSDFAPDNSNAPVTSTPEPASACLVAAAAGVFALRARRRRTA